MTRKPKRETALTWKRIKPGVYVGTVEGRRFYFQVQHLYLDGTIWEMRKVQPGQIADVILRTSLAERKQRAADMTARAIAKIGAKK